MNSKSGATERVLSIDVFRGLTMFLLIGEFTGFAHHLVNESLHGTLIYSIGQQFHHHPWNGLRFWDLIQPFFMFIVGLSLPFAAKIRLEKGDTSQQVFRHVLKRSAILLLLGWGLYCVGPGKITWQFQNVLAQIAFTYLLAYLIMEKPFGVQIAVTIGLLLITEIIYRSFSAPGFEQPFVEFKNFGSWLDVQYGGESGDGWASFNAIPTAAHTIWGVLVGKLLMTDCPAMKKLKIMLITGAALVLAGYLLNPITPIIKRIATSSFVVVSAGWTILALSLFYWLVDILGFRGKWTLMFSVVGMNSLFIYLFAHLDGAQFIEHILHPFTSAILGWLGELPMEILTSACVWAALWWICYWMYKKRLFIKI